MELLIQRETLHTSWRIVLCLLLLLLAGVRLRAQVANEYEVKAAFLYKFASFVEWPEGSGVPGLGGNSLRPAAGAEKCIAVVGQDPFGTALDEVVAGKFSVRRFRSGQEPTECRIVFIAASEKKRLPALLEHLRHSAVLTVGDTPGFCEQGGIINLTLTGNHVSLEINPDAAVMARLQLSSRLLSLARIVHQPGQGSK